MMPPNRQGCISQPVSFENGTSCGNYLYEGYVPTKSALDQAWLNAAKADIDYQLHKAKATDDHYLKMAELAKKSEIAEKRDEAIFARKIKREMAVLSAFKNGDGFICVQMTMPDGTAIYTPPVLKVRGLKMVVLDDPVGSDTRVLVSWEDVKEHIILSGKQLCADGMRRALEKHGVVIVAGRDRKKEMAELVFAFLYESAIHVQMPSILGWSHTEEGWFFYDSLDDLDYFKFAGDECDGS